MEEDTGMRTIEQRIEIAAPRERVWDVLLEDETFRQWTSAFMEGSFAETDWRAGSPVRFLDPAGMGIVGHIVVSDRPERLEIEYDGVLLEGKEDYDGDEARQWKGARETYQLSERGGRTTLSVTSDMVDDHYDGMSEAWVRALEKVRALAESR